MDLGGTIKNLRQKRGITQNAMADSCDITQTYLSQIENNAKEPTLSVLKAISKKLGVPLPILFFLTLDESDVKPDKRAAFNHLAPSIKSMISEFFINASIAK